MTRAFRICTGRGMVEMTYGNFEPINELERRTKAGGDCAACHAAKGKWMDALLWEFLLGRAIRAWKSQLELVISWRPVVLTHHWIELGEEIWYYNNALWEMMER